MYFLSVHLGADVLRVIDTKTNKYVKCLLFMQVFHKNNLCRNLMRLILDKMPTPLFTKRSAGFFILLAFEITSNAQTTFQKIYCNANPNKGISIMYPKVQRNIYLFITSKTLLSTFNG